MYDRAPSIGVLQPSKHKKICITFIQRRPNVIDVGPALHKCYTNVLWGDVMRTAHILSNTKHLYNIYTMLGQRQRRCPNIV